MSHCIRNLEKILSGAGLQTSLQDFAPDRANLIARIGGVGSTPPLRFTDHVDTVPRSALLSVDPFAGEIIDGKMYGRGSIGAGCPTAPECPSA
jgi:succinyl-diaminopimelate desuccinylase